MAITAPRRISRSGTMTLEEFKRWLKQFDADKDGRISREELRGAVRSVGGWFTTRKAERGLREADADGNGFVDENEIPQLVAFAERSLGIRIIVP